MWLEGRSVNGPRTESTTDLVIPVVNDMSGLSVDGGRDILNLDKILAIASNIDVSAKWVPMGHRVVISRHGCSE
jgi:hypothetical protein